MCSEKDPLKLGVRGYSIGIARTAGDMTGAAAPRVRKSDRPGGPSFGPTFFETCQVKNRENSGLMCCNEWKLLFAVGKFQAKNSSY